MTDTMTVTASHIHISVPDIVELLQKYAHRTAAKLSAGPGIIGIIHPATPATEQTIATIVRKMSIVNQDL